MIHHIWTIPCRLSLVDQESNNVSLIGVLEEVTIPTELPQQPSLALVPALLDVVTLWARQNDEQPVVGSGRLSLVSPNGEPLLVHEYEIDLSQNKRIRCVGRVLGFPALVHGTWHFRIERRIGEAGHWEAAATLPLWVNIQQGQIPTAPQRNGGTH